jgi:hypothetical protein
MKTSTRETIIVIFIVLLLAACTPAATPQADTGQEEQAPTLTLSATETPPPTETLTPTPTPIPPTPTLPAPEGADLPDSAVRSVNEQGQDVILDQPGGDALWTLIEDENGELAWQQPTASPETIAIAAEQLNQELSAASAEYINNLPGVNSPETQSSPSTMVVEYALSHGYEELHYDQEVGAIAATNADGKQVWFFGNAGVVAVQEGPERTADQINLEEGWFVRPERHTLSVEGIDLEVEILNRETGIVYEQGGEEERVYFQWQEMPESAKQILLEDLVSRFGYRGKIQVLIQDDLDGWGLRSEDWAEDMIYENMPAK